MPQPYTKLHPRGYLLTVFSGNMHLIDGDKNDSNPELASPAQGIESFGHPSGESSSQNTKVGSDAYDWAAIRKQAEAVDSGKPLELNGC
jgi:hypothetical protein